MKYFSIIFWLISFFLISSCSLNNEQKTEKKEQNNKDDVKVSYIYQNDETFNTIKKQGAIIVKQTEVALGTALKNAMKDGGPEHAIEFCNHEAMRITDSMSVLKDVTIRRIAKKNRNPKNATNEVESKIFKQYVMEYLTGTQTKPRIAINTEGHPVYYKLIKTNSMCLTCHGKPGETMSNDLAKKIQALYPEDKAINFEDGHPRGMWAVTFNKLNVDSK